MVVYYSSLCRPFVSRSGNSFNSFTIFGIGTVHILTYTVVQGKHCNWFHVFQPPLKEYLSINIDVTQ